LNFSQTSKLERRKWRVIGPVTYFSINDSWNG